MADPFENQSAGLTSPLSRAVDVTPSDVADLTTSSRGLWIGTAGDVKVTTVGGDTVTFKNVPNGMLSCRARRVFATGTTALNIIAVW